MTESERILLKAELDLMDNSFDWTTKNKGLSEYYHSVAVAYSFKHDDDLRTYRKLLEFKGAIVGMESERALYVIKNGSNQKMETLLARNELFMSVCTEFEALKTKYEEVKALLAITNNKHVTIAEENKKLLKENDMLKETLITLET